MTPAFEKCSSPSSEDMAPNSRALFGEDAGWNREDWRASDDRVRGGKSASHLTVSESHVVFYGNLDISTLGGAGFASQRTVGDDRTWDLSNYEGIALTLGDADGKTYTFILKDEILPPSENGREQSTLSYEYEFVTGVEKSPQEPSTIFIPWDALKATYRGKDRTDAPKLDIKNIKRFSIMMRSFFGVQEGDFSLTVISIAASKAPTAITRLQSNDGFFSWLARKLWKL